MKRFASHYVYIPSYGFLKQYVIEINSNGCVAALYPLEEEAESIIWIPGVILLITQVQLSEVEKTRTLPVGKTIAFDEKQVKIELPVGYNPATDLKLTAIRLYPFDFIRMQPTENTMLQVLDHCIF